MTEEPILATCRKVLVVDDYEDQAESLGMLLKTLGHDARVVYDGFTALETARSFLPDVALIDIGLPGLSGFEVAKRIRENPQLDRVVLVAQTGWGHVDDHARSTAAGFDHHLIKPLDIAELQRILAAGPHPAPEPARKSHAADTSHHRAQPV